MRYVSSLLPLFVAISAFGKSIYFFDEDLMKERFAIQREQIQQEQIVEASSERVVTSGVATAPIRAMSGVDMNVHFKFNSAELLDSYKSELDKLAQDLKANPDTKVKISGHADSIGTNEVNQKISELRAEAVRDYLSQEGVSNNLEVEWHGEEQPISDVNNENRRVEIKNQ